MGRPPPFSLPLSVLHSPLTFIPLSRSYVLFTFNRDVFFIFFESPSAISHLFIIIVYLFARPCLLLLFSIEGDETRPTNSSRSDGRGDESSPRDRTATSLFLTYQYDKKQKEKNSNECKVS